MVRDRSGTTRDHLDHVDYRRYFDVAAFLDGSLPDLPTPDYGTRDDGRALFYRGEENVLFGDPESGKTWVALAAAREVLGDVSTGRVLVIDLDHNGPRATVSRLLALGASSAVLVNAERFLYIEPEDRLQLRAVVAEMALWRPDVVVLDSVGELLPMFGSSSNSADEYTVAHRAVVKPLTKTGAAVLTIDHLAKGSESRTLGPGGTAAKRRAIGGVALRVTVEEPFRPGAGGSARLTVNKDRHGGVRQWCPARGKGEPSAGLFELVVSAHDQDQLEAKIRAPHESDRPLANFSIAGADAARLAADVAELGRLDPAPHSKRDVQERLKWGGDRAVNALKAWREQQKDNAA